MKHYRAPSPDQWTTICLRPAMDAETLKGSIDKIFKEVQLHGDSALKDFTRRYDQVDLAEIMVDEVDIESSTDMLDISLKESIRQAYYNIYKFHVHQKLKVKKIETVPGVSCWQESRAIEKVGLYIPGGSAPLFSTILMLGIPAQIAGCQEIILCTPPQHDGEVHPAILYAARICGITQIAKVGGSQAIAAMTYGTESIPSVYKIFGPGNQYVTTAKQKALTEGVAIDMPAGPSEVLVYAEKGSNPTFIASDLLSQAEHGPDSQVVLVTTEMEIIQAVSHEIEIQLNQLPRAAIASQALDHSFAVSFQDRETAFSFINTYAPEHLIISIDDAHTCVPMIQNAGSVFLGPFTPESAGDYASGTNHTLPTAAYARAYSGVSLDSFIKKITFQQIDDAGLKHIGPAIIDMARAEMLEAHAQAVVRRLNE